MPEYIVNLWLDGYDTEEQMEEACDEFIYDQLNFTASSARVKRSDYAALRARVARLEEALREIRDYSAYEHPDVQVLNHRNRIIVEISECSACQHAKQVNWPPSGLCSEHYDKYRIAQRRVEEMHDYKQTWEPRGIARRALEEK